MRSALRAEPAVVAPNVGEAEGAVGHEFNDADDLALGLDGPDRDGRRRGGDHARGRLRGHRRRRRQRHRYEVEIEQLEPVSAVGSGDCFLAGYVAARYEAASPRECLAYGVACGAESTQHFGAGSLEPERGRAAAAPGEVGSSRCRPGSAEAAGRLGRC